MTLAEVLVAMAVTSVVMAVATGGIVQMYRASSRTDVLSTEMTQLQTAFQLLDRSVRYATAISQPNPAASAGGDWYVEWTSSADGITTVCNQLRLDPASGLLQRRSEPAGGQLTDWTTVASSLGGTQPFTLQPASTSGYPHQRLTVDVTVRPIGSGQLARRSVFSFTALNTSLATVSTGVCTDMARL
jgi:type II secretory pathway component PulJ